MNKTEKASAKGMSPMGGKGPMGHGGAPRGKAKLDPKSLGRLVKLLIHDHPVLVLLIIVCIALNAIIGVMPAVYIKTITSYIVDGLALAKQAGGAAAWAEYSPLVGKSLLTMTLLFVAGIICGTAREQFGAVLTQTFLDDMRKRMFNKMEELPIKFFDTNTHGDIMSLYTNDIDTLRELVDNAFPSLVRSVTIILAVFFMMVYFSLWLALIILGGVSPVAVSLGRGADDDVFLHGLGCFCGSLCGGLGRGLCGSCGLTAGCQTEDHSRCKKQCKEFLHFLSSYSEKFILSHILRPTSPLPIRQRRGNTGYLPKSMQ